MSDEAPIVYYAHPIDQVSGDIRTLEAQQLFLTGLDLPALLHQAGFTVYDPARGWSVVGPPRKEVWQVNSWALGRASGLLAWLPDGQPTVGVPMEIERAAVGLNMPVAVVGGLVQHSWALAGRRGVEVFPDTSEGREQAVGWLRGQIALADRFETVMQSRRALVTGDGPTPTKTYRDDVGWDLYYHGDKAVTIEPGRAADIPAGVRIQWPEGMWALVVGRSSTFKKRVLVATGIIDPGYRGEYWAVCHNLGSMSVTIEPGERIAQAIPIGAAWVTGIERVDRLEESERGESGFGSSGR